MAEPTHTNGLSILNPEPRNVEGPKLLHELIVKGKDAAIHHVTRSEDETILSYEQLHAQAEVLAARILDVVQGTGDPPASTPDPFVVPLLIPQSPELYIAQLAILKAGGAFCPLNLDAPRERINFILNDVTAQVVICSPDLADRIHQNLGRVAILTTDSANAATTESSTERYRTSHIRPPPDALAYVMYTSGSTGTPKGVGISHRAATQALLAHDRHIPQFQRFLQFAAPTFDVSVFEIFFPLMRGSTLVCCDRGEMLSDLPGTIVRANVDACELTPSVAGSLLKTRRAAPCLKLLLTIGEMLTDTVVREFGGESAESSILWGMYGPTEATIHCTLQPAFLKKQSRKNIGFPLDNVSAFIIDADPSQPFQVLPLGQSGELAVGGSQLAIGYVQRPEQTAAAFIDSPYGRVYRTGDKAIMMADGTIECLGRINDTQVKLNGQRMELGEVEQVVLGTPGCHSSVAAIISNTLVAFVAVDHPEASYEAIIDRCKSWLPAFMVPSDIRLMEDFPRLPSGKVDRKRLVAEYEIKQQDGHPKEEDYADSLEQKLCLVASDLLGRQLRPSSRTVSAGIDSLVAIEYASSLRQSGVYTSVIDILASATFHDLYSTLKRQLQKPSQQTNHDRQVKKEEIFSKSRRELLERSRNDIDLGQIRHVAPCTALQQSMISETLRDARLYVNEICIAFPTDTSPDTIQKWFQKICGHNDVLRSGFDQVENELCHITWETLKEDQIRIVQDFARIEPNSIEQFLRRPLDVQIFDSSPSASQGPIAVITIHHAIYDGWSIDLLLRSLNCLYRGERLPTASQFHDVMEACDDAQERSSVIAKEYWAEQLQSSTSNTIPNFHTTPVREVQICTVRKNLITTMQQVKDMSRRFEVSDQVVFQAALAWLWSAITGTEDVNIGSVLSGRTLPVDGIESAMGPFVATLPLRVQFGQLKTTSELMQVIHANNRDSLQHSGLSLSEIKKAAGIPPLSRLFDVIFAFQESLPSRRAGTNEIREINHKDAVEAKLLVEIQPEDGKVSCQITWHSDIFSTELIDGFLEQFESIIDHFLTTSSEPLGNVRACIPSSQLSAFNGDPRSLDVLPSLATLVQQTVERYPENVAIVFADSMSPSSMDAESLTYAELNARANQMARYLQRHGVRKGDVVAIVMEKSLLLYCGILAILKTGSAYLPMLPNLPGLRKQRIMEQAKPRLCLTSTSLEGQLIREGLGQIAPISFEAASQYSSSNLDIKYNCEDLAYVIYTSGTTGVPKGVAVTNRNMLSNIEALSALYPHDPSSKMLQACSQAFDVSVFEIFFTWANGMCLSAATNDTLFGNLSHAIKMFKATHLSMTVTVASLLRPEEVPSVEFLVTSGEAMTDEVLDKWAEQLWQGYGPSETTNICTVRKVQRGDSSQFLGWAFDNTSTFVCYPGTSELVPFGCIGEFCFGGDQVASGYLQMPELTAEKFFEHPQYGRLYRSGDKGRMLPDGSLIIMGRIDTQIKLRGLRIELQEIQRVVLHAGFARACEVIVVTQHSTKTEQLALFYVPSLAEHTQFQLLPMEENQDAGRALRQELESALPDYMVPVFIIPISMLPRTSSGKVDRNQLKTSLEELDDNDAATYSAEVDQDKLTSEWTEVERAIAQVAAVTADVEVKTITQWTSFATLGIDSILAMSLARRLQTALGRRVPLSAVLKNPSVGRLAAALNEAPSHEQSEEPTVDLLPREIIDAIQQKISVQCADSGVQRILPCTPLQEGMLFSNTGSATSYCNTMVFKLQATANDMISYWRTAFERHEIMRTCFASTDSISNPVVQVVLSNVRVQYHHLQVEPDSCLDDTVEEVKRLVPPAVDSGKPPVLFATIQTPQKESYVCFVCHHALYDGISMSNFLREIETIAKGGSLLVPVKFDKFLASALRPVPGTDDFWQEHFDGFTPALLKPDTNADDVAAATIFGEFDTQSLDYVELLLKERGTSLLSFLQSSWAVTLSILQGSQDICFGNVVSGRSLPVDDIDRLVAPCFNTIPVRVDVARSRFGFDLAKRIQTLNRDSLPYQFTALRQIQKLVANSTRLFDSIFILQPGQLKLDDNIWSLELDDGAMDVPLVCEVTPDRERNRLRIGCYRDRGVISHDTLQLAYDTFRYLLSQNLEQPYSQILTRTDLPDEWQAQYETLQFQSPMLPHAGEDESKDEDDLWSDTEQLVRSAVARLTSLPESRIAKDKLLFHYGVDSIGIIQIVGMLEKSSLHISIADVMEHPTCARIAARANVTGLRGFESNKSTQFDFQSFQDEVRGQIRGSQELEDILPCPAIQQAMLSQSTASDERLYINFVSWELAAEVDAHSAVNAWKRLQGAQQILRTGFVPVNSTKGSYAIVVHAMGEQRGPNIEEQVTLRGGLDVEQWRHEAADSISNDLSCPPWRVVIHESQSGPLMMHLVMHHALYDAHSLQLILENLRTALDPNTTLPTQDVRQVLSTIMVNSEDNPSFWTEKAAATVVNKFPTMTPLVEAHGRSATSKTSRLSVSKVKSRAADLGVSVQAALQVAWSRLLAAYLGESNVTFGVVLSGRSTQQDLGTLFPMISTLPVIASNDGEVIDQLEDMMKYNAGLLRHSRTPMSSIQNWLRLPGVALFDTILVYQVADNQESAKPWRVVEEHASVEYAVSLEIEEVAEDLKFNLVCDTSILPIEQARIVLTQFDALLADTLRASEGTTSSIDEDAMSILPPKTPIMPCADELLHKMFESSSQRNPEAIALEFVEQLGDPNCMRRWTYAELDKAGNRIVNFLSSKSVSQGSIVAVCFNKAPEAYFSILGILKAGCCFLALDPTAPAARQEFILKDSGAACLLAEDLIASQLGFDSPVPVHAITSQAISQGSADVPHLSRAILSSDPCYCLYTSGTTGTPKGCLISHENTVQAMLAFTELFSGHWTERSRWLQFASFHFDVSVLEQYWSWHVGITVVSAPRDLILSNLIETISELRITHIDLTPSLARLVHPDDVPSLCEGVFITGGEQLRQDVLEAWGPEKVIYNAYGPTEATIGVTMYQRVPANGRPSNIGRQFPNVGSYILKPGTDEPVLRGAVGELCVSGKLVGIGYLNRPELTTERFAYLEKFGERVYRTGDLVRVLHDGTFDFLGRADDQVKLRGQRLEIGEINHAIKSSLPYSADVATLVSKHGDQQDRDHLVSFITTAAERDERDELKICIDKHAFEMSMTAQNACKGRLSGYMVPSYILCVPWIPLSANNKADIKRLRSLFQELSMEELRQIATGTKSVQRQLNPVERRIAQIISEVADIEQSDILHSSTILELGIDSISVTRLSRALKAAGFDQATPSSLLKSGQIERIAGLVSGKANGIGRSRTLEAEQIFQACYQQNLGIACEALGVQADEVEYIVPCTPLQEGMVARAHAHAGGSKPYFNQFEMRLGRDVSMSRLKEAWVKLQETASILRTAFLQSEKGFMQVALKRQSIRWKELTTENDDELGEVIKQRHARWVATNEVIISHPFEIDCIAVGGERVLVVRIFHALYDAHSLTLMLERVAASVKGIAIDTSSTFYDALQAGPLSIYQEAQPFWNDLFRDWQGRPLSGSATSSESSVISRSIDIQGFEQKRKSLGVTHQTMVQTAWFAVLQEHLQAQPCFGIVYSGRSIDLAGAENVIGPLFNTLPFTTEIGAGITWDQLTQQVQTFNTSVLDFVHVPLRNIQKWCSNGRPLFDSLFTFDREDIVESKGDELWEVSGSSAAPDYSLALEAILNTDGRIRVHIVARNNVLDLEYMLDQLESKLCALVESGKNTVIMSPDAAIDAYQEDDASRGSKTTGDPTPRSASPTTSSISSWPDQGHELRHEIALLAGVTDDEILPGMTIFDFGFDSIDAIRLASKAASLGYHVSAGDLLRGATVDSMLQTEGEGTRTTDDLSRSDTLGQVVRDLEQMLKETGHDLTDLEAVLPTTPLQDSMVAEMITSNFQRYYNQEVFKISAGVDLDRLKSAWKDVHASSPILRTTFLEVSSAAVTSAYCQIVKRSTFKIGEVTLESLEETESMLNEIRNDAASWTGEDGLFRLTFCHIGSDAYAIVSIAHALYDGQSLSMIYDDVQEAYRGNHVNRPDYKPHLARLASTATEEANRFWSNTFHDVQPTCVQALAKADSVNDGVHRQELDSFYSTSALKEACKRLGITPQVLAQASWAVVLASMARNLQPTFGLVLSGRDTEEVQQMNFPTMNTVAMRTTLHGTVNEFLRHVQTAMSHIMAFQHTPLRQIQKLAKSQGRPLFDTLFVFQASTATSTTQEPLMVPVQGTSAVEYPVCVEFELAGSKPSWRIACDSCYGTEESSKQILADLDKAMQFFCEASNDQLILKTGTTTDAISICGLDSFTPSSKSIKLRSANEEQMTSTKPNHDEEEIHPDVLHVIEEISGAKAATIQPGDQITSLLDSISAIKVCALLRKRGLKLSVRQLLGAGTIAGISDLVRKSSGTDRGPSLPTLESLASIDLPMVLRDLGYAGLLERASIPAQLVEQVLPALPMQVYMLSVWQNTDGALFWPTFEYKLKGNVTRERVMSAWHQLVKDIPILRTEFLATGSQDLPFLQLVLEPSSSADEQVSESEKSWMWHSSSCPFVRVDVAQRAGNDTLEISLRIHHALYDAFSLPMIMSRFEALCKDETCGPAVADDKLWKSFASLHAALETTEHRQKFWTSYLKELVPSCSATTSKGALDSTDQSKAETVSDYRPAVMPIHQQLTSTMVKHGVTMQHLFFAAYAKILARDKYLKSDRDVVIGIYLANRSNLPGLDALPYPTLALLPLRVRKPLDRTILELAGDIKKDIDVISETQNISVGLWEIEKWTGVVLDTFVNFLPAVHDSAESSDTSGVRLELVPEPEKVDAVQGPPSATGLARPEMPQIAGNNVRDCHLETVDVEAALRNGSLDIGVFGRPGMLSRTQTSQYIDGMLELLGTIA